MHSKLSFVVLVASMVWLHISDSGFANETADKRFLKDIKPILAQFCYRCHNDKKTSANLNLQKLETDLTNGSGAETWHDVLNKLNLGEMPPEDEKQPNEIELQKVVNWITGELKRAVEAKRSTGGKVVLRRLTRYEYANTMHDLLGVDLDYAADLPPEPSSPDGFKNNGATLGMSSLQLEYYLKSARRGLKTAIVTGAKPQVYTHTADKSVAVKGRKNNVQVGNRMPVGGMFQAKIDDFPRHGEFLIRVKAAARCPDDKPYPRMSVSVGVRADVRSPAKTVGEVDVDASLDAPQFYEFRGRIEDFPLPGKNPKYPGLLIRVTHNGEPAAQSKRDKKKKSNESEKEVPEDPTQPLIVVESVSFEGPIFDAWPPSSHTRIFFPSESSSNEKQYAPEVLQRFMTRAFRRTVKDAEVEQMMALYNKIRSRAESFERAMSEVLATVLISPEFLYLMEPRDTNAKEPDRKQRLTDYELASRLSYFLWSTMPDEKLLALAANGELRNPAKLSQHVRTMLDDKRSWRFVEQFTNQWLDLSGLDRVAVNPEFYPDFDDLLKPDMRLETQHFFAEILKHDLSAMNLIDSDFIMINRPLADHYGIAGPRGMHFERVKLSPDDRRGGLLTQAGILLANSTGEDSHPIRRAVWVLDRLLDDPPPPPPPDVPELKSDQPDFAAFPLKKQLELHRSKAACKSCHQGIDPWGVPFENFDAVGLWRTEVSKPGKKKRQFIKSPVDAVSMLPNGKQLDGIMALKQHLLDHERERFSRALVKKLTTYALGRSVELADRETIDKLTAEFKRHDYQLSDLIVAIVQSELFQTK